MDQLFDEILSNTTSGASETYIKILNHVILGNLKDPDLPEALMKSAGDMVPLCYLARRLAQAPTFKWKDTAGDLQREIRQQGVEAGIQLYKQLADADNILLCHSRSGSVLKALEHRKNRIDTIYQTVSSPGEEGRSAGETLKENGFKVKLIDDGDFPKALKKGAVPVMGADAVTTGFFVNKVSSADIVKAALDAEITPLVLAGREKLIPPDIYGDRPLNPLFQRVPLTGLKIIVGSQTFTMPRHLAKLAALIGSQDSC
jgi:translation initiation factor 2B subunit (eIF-2B alpha/beta/delta family)